MSLPWLNYTIWQNTDSLGWLNLILVILKHSAPLARRQRNWEQEKELAHHFQCEDGRAYMRRNTVSPWLPSTAAKSLQSCPTLSDPMDCSLPGSSVHGIFQARVLEWGAIVFSGISHRYTYILTLLNVATITLPIPTHLGWYRTPVCISCAIQQIWVAICFTYGNVSLNVPLSIHLTLSSLLPLSISLFSMSVHCWLVNRFFGTILLDSIYVLEYDIYLSLSDLLHSV